MPLVAWGSLPPLTLSDIETREFNSMIPSMRSFSCGCESRDSANIWVCPYHKGYMDSETVLSKEVAHLSEQVADYRVLIGHAPSQGFSDILAERDALLMAWNKTKKLLPGPRGREVFWTAEESLQMEIVKKLEK